MNDFLIDAQGITSVPLEEMPKKDLLSRRNKKKRSAKGTQGREGFNLRPAKSNKAGWQKGESGNITGRPMVGESWRELIKEFSQRATPADVRPLGATWRDALIHAAFRHAIHGSAPILKELLDRSDGRLPLRLQVIKTLDESGIENPFDDPILSEMFFAIGMTKEYFQQIKNPPPHVVKSLERAGLEANEIAAITGSGNNGNPDN